MSLPENFYLTLQCDLSEAAPEGPGWYVYAARHENGKPFPMIPLWRVTKEQAHAIGKAFDGCFKGNEGHPMPSQLVESGGALIKQAIDAQIAEAERVALKLAKLRRLRDAEREDDEESPTS